MKAEINKLGFNYYMSLKAPLHRVRMKLTWDWWAEFNGLNAEHPSGQMRKVAHRDDWHAKWNENIGKNLPMRLLSEEYLAISHSAARLESDRQAMEFFYNQLICDMIQKLQIELHDGIVTEETEHMIDKLTEWRKGLKPYGQVYRSVGQFIQVQAQARSEY